MTKRHKTKVTHHKLPKLPKKATVPFGLPINEWFTQQQRNYKVRLVKKYNFPKIAFFNQDEDIG